MRWDARLFAFFFSFFVIFILVPYTINCIYCSQHQRYCDVCDPTVWMFTIAILVLFPLRRRISIILAAIPVILMMAFLSLAAKAEIAMSMLTTYFIAGTIISSALIFHSIYRGIQRAIKRQRVEEKRTAIQRPMIAPPQLEAQLKAARAKPPAVAILKQCGVASAARGIVVLRDPSSSPMSLEKIAITIERAGRGFKLIVDGVECPMDSLAESSLFEALRKCSSMKSISPRYDMYYDLILRRDELDDIRQRLPSTSRLELAGMKTVIKRRVLQPACLKRIATHQFVRYRFPSRIPKKLYMLGYGRAFDRAVKTLAATRSLEKAEMKFFESFMKDAIVKQCIEQGMVSMDEVRWNALRGFEAFMKTELYSQYRIGYSVPKPRIILIDDSYAVFAQPDFKSIDNGAIIDVKVFDPNKASKEERERVELEMRVFQLAYPGAKAVIMGFPYGEEYDTPRSLELPPLSPSEATLLLGMLKSFCAESGSYETIDLPKYEVVCYTTNPDGYEFEVYEYEVA